MHSGIPFAHQYSVLKFFKKKTPCQTHVRFAMLYLVCTSLEQFCTGKFVLHTLSNPSPLQVPLVGINQYNCIIYQKLAFEKMY